MRKIAVLLTLLCAFTFAAAAQTATPMRDIAKDEIKTLVGAKSDRLSVMGFDLSMSERAALDALAKSPVLIGERDGFNPRRIYVYEKLDGKKGKALLYLIWDGQPRMRMMTIFEDFKPYLKGDVQRLLTFETVDFKSPFVRRFLGAPDRQAVTLDVASIGLHHTTYYFDCIGLEITRKKSNWQDVGVVFALVPPNPGARCGKRL